MNVAGTIRGLLEPRTPEELLTAELLELSGTDLLQGLIDGLHRALGPDVRTRLTPAYLFGNGDGWITGLALAVATRPGGHIAYVRIGIGNVSIFEGRDLGTFASFDLPLDRYERLVKSPLL